MVFTHSRISLAKKGKLLMILIVKQWPDNARCKNSVMDTIHRKAILYLKYTILSHIFFEQIHERCHGIRTQIFHNQTTETWVSFSSHVRLNM